MARSKKPERFAPPIMQAFRSAFRERDAAKPLDLKNEAGERIIAGRRSSPRNAVSESALRQELSEDLASLLNTVNLASCEDLRLYPHVTKSILNYGLNDLSAISTEENAVHDIGGRLVDVLARYESRLVPGSIAVKRDTAIDETSTRIRFNVHAEMHATPVDVMVEFVADIEVDSGKMKLSRL